ncbi:MAG: hypothetical protein M5U34_20085 [Chloroflexi bacterium]|nr:hypothetical protein [Chloroflexota bacterium]
MAVPIFIAEKSNGYSGQTSLWSTSQPEPEQSKLLLGDVLEMLRKLPDNSVDFAFARSPYNLNKKYNSYSDDLSITLVFPNWITK